MTEQWKTIEGFEAYEVSDLGRVRSVERRVPSSRWIPTRRVRARILKPYANHRGYLRIHLFKNRKSHTFSVHRLVAKAFLPNPLGLPDVNHKGKTTDNRACKLEWLSTEDHGKDRSRREQRGDGVHFIKAGKRTKQRKAKWRATYAPEPGKTKFLGEYDTYKEAKAVHDAAVATL